MSNKKTKNHSGKSGSHKSVSAQPKLAPLTNVTLRIVEVCFLILTFMVLFLHYFVSQADLIPAASVLGVLALIFLFYGLQKKIVKGFLMGKESVWFVCLLIVCFVVKLIFVLKVRIEPSVDYQTFYNCASQLADSFVTDFHYVALFPHIAGYATFLSLFFKLFGSGLLVAPVINVFLSTASMALIFYIGRSLGGRGVAIFASILWILCPSQTIYNIFVLSEPLYTTLLLVVWALLIWKEQMDFSQKLPSAIGFFVGIGVLLSVIQAVRPLSLVVLISLAIWMFLIQKNSSKIIWRNKLICFAVAVLVFVICNFAWGSLLDVRLGEQTARTQGYTMLVGANYDSMGQWNQEDSDTLSQIDEQTGGNAELTMQGMQQKFFERLHEPTDWLAHFFHKIEIFLGSDIGGVGYMYSILPSDSAYINLAAVCNIFYYFVFFMAAVSLLRQWKTRQQSIAVLMPLFILGLTAAHLFAEVAARYHYAILVPLILMTAQNLKSVSK